MCLFETRKSGQNTPFTLWSHTHLLFRFLKMAKFFLEAGKLHLLYFLCHSSHRHRWFPCLACSNNATMKKGVMVSLWNFDFLPLYTTAVGLLNPVVVWFLSSFSHFTKFYFFYLQFYKLKSKYTIFQLHYLILTPSTCPTQFFSKNHFSFIIGKYMYICVCVCKHIHMHTPYISVPLVWLVCTWSPTFLNRKNQVNFNNVFYFNQCISNTIISMFSQYEYWFTFCICTS